MDSPLVAQQATVAEEPGATAPGGWMSWLGVVLAVHLLVVAVAYDTAPVLSGAAAASAVVVVAGVSLVRTGVFGGFSYIFAFTLGTAGSMVYAHLGYYYATDLPKGRYHEVTMWLTALHLGCALFGAAVVHYVLPAVRIRHHGRSVFWESATSWVTGSMCLAFTGAALLRGLDTRHELTPFNVSSYLLSGFSVLIFPFYFVMGSRMRARLWHPTNITLLVLLLVSAVLAGLSGGREHALWMVTLFWGGVLVSRLPRFETTTLSSGLLVAAIVFIVVIGIARKQSGFAFSSVESRLDVIEETAVGLDEHQDASLQTLFGRTFEFAGQIVIDHVHATGYRAGFEHFERIVHLFVPKLFAPDKLPMEDGPEVLARDYGYEINELLSVPITLVADAYRRGGALWVAVVGLLVGCWLRALVTITYALFREQFAYLAIALQSLLFLRVYTASVPGFIMKSTYYWFKGAVLLWCVFALAYFFTPLARQPSEGALARR